MREKRQILLVDDDPDDRELFIDALREVDDQIECTVAKDGQQALEILQNISITLPDFIFLDLRMPRINGKNCLLIIKGDERLKNIPVIIYSTSRESDDAEEMQKIGAVRFVSKPTNPDEIYYLLSVVLEENWDMPV